MITVSVAVNAVVVASRSAIRTDDVNRNGEVRYRVDDGADVWHHPDEGAAELGKKLLDRLVNLDEAAKKRKRLRRKGTLSTGPDSGRSRCRCQRVPQGCGLG